MAVKQKKKELQDGLRSAEEEHVTSETQADQDENRGELCDETRALREELRAARGNVRALNVIIGLMAEKYPDNLAGMYIRECAKFGLAGDLLKKEISGLSYLARIMDGATLEKLVALCSEEAVPEEENPQEFEMPDVPETAVQARSEAKARTRKKATGAADGQ